MSNALNDKFNQIKQAVSNTFRKKEGTQSSNHSNKTNAEGTVGDKTAISDTMPILNTKEDKKDSKTLIIRGVLVLVIAALGGSTLYEQYFSKGGSGDGNNAEVTTESLLKNDPKALALEAKIKAKKKEIEERKKQLRENKLSEQISQAQQPASVDASETQPQPEPQAQPQVQESAPGPVADIPPVEAPTNNTEAVVTDVPQAEIPADNPVADQPIQEEPVVEAVVVAPEVAPEPTPEVAIEEVAKPSTRRTPQDLIGETPRAEIKINQAQTETASPRLPTTIDDVQNAIVGGNTSLSSPAETTFKNDVPPPSYQNIGRGLVYTCQTKHWACIDRASYFQCQDHQLAAREGRALPLCIIKEVYATDEDCARAQQQLVDAITPTPECTSLDY